MIKKLILLVILMFLGAITGFSGLLVLFAQKSFSSPLVWGLIALGLLSLVYSLVRIIRINSEWKISKSKIDFRVIAKWTVEGEEWERFKQLFLSDATIKKDARFYALFSAAVSFFFALIILLTNYKLAISISVSVLIAVAFFGFIYYIVYKVNVGRNIPYRQSNRAIVECGTEVIMFNGVPVFLSTPQLGVTQIRIENKGIVNSIVFTLEFRMGYRKINQEHRIPFPGNQLSTVIDYINHLKTLYKIS